MSVVQNVSYALTNSEWEVLFKKGYSVGSQIGKGSYASVHLAEYKVPNSEDYKPKILACRILENDQNPQIENFLIKELVILSKINNPHLIQIHSILAIRLKVFIFMRFEENGNLLEFMQLNNALSESLAKRWFRQMACGLEYLHNMEIAHRDLKCENILISKSGNVKLADFGFATYCVDESGTDILNTTYCGSTAYAAPEVLSRTPHYPKPADVWSLGVVLYIMLTATMPFDDSKSTNEVVESQITQSWKFQLKEYNVMVSTGAMLTLSETLEPDIIQRLSVQMLLSQPWVKRSSTKPSYSTNEDSPASYQPASDPKSIYTLSTISS